MKPLFLRLILLISSHSVIASDPLWLHYFNQVTQYRARLPVPLEPGQASRGLVLQSYSANAPIPNVNPTGPDLDRREIFSSADGNGQIDLLVNAPRLQPQNSACGNGSFGAIPFVGGQRSITLSDGSLLTQSLDGRCTLNARNQDQYLPSPVATHIYFRNLLLTAKINHVTDLKFPYAHYIFGATTENNNILIEGHKDLVIDFQGSTLHFVDLEAIGIIIRSSTRVVVKNATLTWDGLILASKGVLARLANSYVLTTEGPEVFDPARPNTPLIVNIATWNSAANSWFSTRSAVYGVRPNSRTTPNISFVRSAPNRYETSADLSKLFFGNASQTDVLVRHYYHDTAAIAIASPTNMPYNQDIGIRNVTFRRVPGSMVLAYRTHGLLLAGNYAGQSSGEPISVAAGAFTLIKCTDVIFENNYLTHHGDDGFNLTSNYQHVVSETTPSTNMPPGTRCFNVISKNSGNENYPLDPVAIFDREMSYKKMVPILSNTRLTPGPIFRGDAFDESNVCLSNLLSSDDVASLYNLTRPPTRFVVRNNTIRDNGGRGLVVQGTNGLILGNNLTRTTGPGISLTSDYSRWLEGPGAANIIVDRTNIFSSSSVTENLKPSGVTYGGLNISPNGLDPLDSTSPYWLDHLPRFPRIQSVVIRQSSVKLSGAAGLLLGSTRNVKIESLLIGRSNQSGIPGVGTEEDAASSGAVVIRKSYNNDLRGLNHAYDPSVPWDISFGRFSQPDITFPAANLWRVVPW